MANPKGNPQNLKRPTPNEARKNGRKGGIASGESRRKMKTFREGFEWLLSLPEGEGQATDVADIENMREIPSANLTAMQRIIVAQFIKASKGDTKAAEFIRDTIGEKPKEKVEVKSDIKTDAIEKVEALVEKELKGKKK